jgi:hypothetical protein
MAAAPGHHSRHGETQLTVRSLDPKVRRRRHAPSAIEREANGEAEAANAPKGTR